MCRLLHQHRKGTLCENQTYPTTKKFLSLELCGRCYRRLVFMTIRWFLVAHSPDRRQLVLRLRYRIVKLWNTATAVLLHALEAHKDGDPIGCLLTIGEATGSQGWPKAVSSCGKTSKSILSLTLPTHRVIRLSCAHQTLTQ